jgi:hypothetical protein
MVRWVRCLLIGGGVLAVLPTVFAASGGRKPAPPPPPPVYSEANEPYLCGQVKNGFFCPQAQVAGEDFIGELVSILNETRSPDAFLVTLSILQEIKPEARTVVPVIIRNAERLRLFKRTNPDQPTEQQKMIVECIAALLNKLADSEAGGLGRGALDAGALIGAAIGAGPGALAGAAVSTPVARPLQQVETSPGTAPEEARPAQDPLLGTFGAETKPATGAVIPGKVKSRPGIVK